MSDIKFDVRIFPVAEPQGNLRAFASVSVEDLIAIRGIRVLDGEKGLFVTMPQSRDKEGAYHDVAFPVNGDLRKQINTAILEAYFQAVERRPLADELRDGASRVAEQSPFGRFGEPAVVVRGGS